ncbi:hypothetical protein GWI33_016451 [Rhynchophorus ferrugineus]|uniref:Uncharacterized protein n=1 Tax=Rhynchophorus ferrugineus TaxID=354439 RepID=A0A834HXC0_RHYFE|nr:hypothetical protein GWI33_016451 [Rhynchophorus ferrugineus]
MKLPNEINIFILKFVQISHPRLYSGRIPSPQPPSTDVVPEATHLAGTAGQPFPQTQLLATGNPGRLPHGHRVQPVDGFVRRRRRLSDETERLLIKKYTPKKGTDVEDIESTLQQHPRKISRFYEEI